MGKHEDVHWDDVMNVNDAPHENVEKNVNRVSDGSLWNDASDGNDLNDASGAYDLRHRDRLPLPTSQFLRFCLFEFQNQRQMFDPPLTDCLAFSYLPRFPPKVRSV